MWRTPFPFIFLSWKWKLIFLAFQSMLSVFLQPSWALIPCHEITTLILSQILIWKNTNTLFTCYFSRRKQQMIAMAMTRVKTNRWRSRRLKLHQPKWRSLRMSRTRSVNPPGTTSPRWIRHNIRWVSCWRPSRRCRLPRTSKLTRSIRWIASRSLILVWVITIMCVSAHLTFYIGGKGTCILSKKKMIFSLYPFGLAHTRGGPV